MNETKPVTEECPRCLGWGRLYYYDAGEWDDCNLCGGAGRVGHRYARPTAGPTAAARREGVDKGER